MTPIPFRLLVLTASLVLASCGQPPDDPAGRPPPADPTADAAAAAAAVEAAARRAPADVFMESLARHCGEAFAGQVVVDVPALAPGGAPDPFAGKALVMHVRDCSNRREVLRIPFHVGEDHSRTWIVSRTPDGLRLQHDHRRPDGSHDPVTMYGGQTGSPGTATRQEFPADPDTVALFREAGLDESVTNTWAMEIEPERRFVYELTRPGGRRFRVEFDLTRTVAAPPTPWGY